MIRCILAVLILGASASAAAERIVIDRLPDLEQLNTIEPNAEIDLRVRGARLVFTGSWENDTAEISGWLHADVLRLARGEGPPYLSEPFSVHLPNTINWDANLQWIEGVMRFGDPDEENCHNGICPDPTGANDVDLNELNYARNWFGNYEGSGDPHLSADVTYDGVIDIDDLNSIRNNFGSPNRYTWSTAAPVPEPTGFTMLVASLSVLSMRRRRFPQ